MQIRSFMGLKIWFSQESAGSIPVLGTHKSLIINRLQGFNFLYALRFTRFLALSTVILDTHLTLVVLQFSSYIYVSEIRERHGNHNQITSAKEKQISLTQGDQEARFPRPQS